jgi:hypothetical protein
MVMMQPEPRRTEAVAQQHRTYHRDHTQTREESARQQVALQEAEHQRLAREHERMVEAHHTYMREQWTVFQRAKHDAPPTLLPLEASRELKSFRVFLQQGTIRILEQAAVNRFETEIRSQAAEGEQVVAQLMQELESRPGRLKLLSRHFGKVRELLRKSIISTTAPELGLPAREAVAHACKFLRRTWSSRLIQNRQAMFSVHRKAGKTVVHMGSSVYGSVFITIPHSLEPDALAAALLAEIKGASRRLITDNSTVAVIDGDHQSLNYQRILDKQIVVRSTKDDCDGFALNLDALLQREPPTAKNAALHLGVPADEAELNAVFPSGGADWDMWSEVVTLWRNRANRQGFAPPASATADSVVESLTKDKNVIVVVAHANRRTLYMPAPPPEGSRLSADEIIKRKEEIATNRPVVYLFCCETAEVSNLASFSEILLECGAAAVLAPQAKIDAERSVDFFEGLVDRRAPPDLDFLAKIKAAERSSKYREMEVWLG